MLTRLVVCFFFFSNATCSKSTPKSMTVSTAYDVSVTSVSLCNSLLVRPVVLDLFQVFHSSSVIVFFFFFFFLYFLTITSSFRISFGCSASCSRESFLAPRRPCFPHCFHSAFCSFFEVGRNFFLRFFFPLRNTFSFAIFFYGI